MNEFIYNEDTRQHTLGDKVIPSVSQVIEPLCNFEGIPEDVLERKTELGNQFHEAIRLHLLDDLDFGSLDPDLVKPMNAFIHFWRYKNFPMVGFHIEKPIYHPTLKYCGKPDLITTTGILDWKLRPYNAVTDILKLEAYKHMVPLTKRERWTVCFDLKGNMTMYKSQHPKAWGIFRRMLERYNSEHKFNELMEAWKRAN